MGARMFVRIRKSVWLSMSKSECGFKCVAGKRNGVCDAYLLGKCLRWYVSE